MAKNHDSKSALGEWLDYRPRRAYLTLMGLLYALLGAVWLYFASPLYPEKVQWIPGTLPAAVIGWAWIVSGAVSLFAGTQSIRKCGEYKGFFALQAQALILALFSFSYWVQAIVTPQVEDGDPGGLGKALIYLALYTAHVFVSRSPSPSTATGELLVIHRVIHTVEGLSSRPAVAGGGTLEGGNYGEEVM